ncbi:hypothetical protein NA57DRAFT_34628, partial [Rhizodiscina lignyota]
LQSENDELKRTNNDSQIAYQTKAGEAALVRRRLENSTSEFEKRIRQIQESHTDVFSKQKAQLELAIREKKQLEEDHWFHQHDLRQAQATTGAKQSRGTLRGVGERTTSIDPGATTPKKSLQHLPYRDGFDDGDILMASPSKIKDKQKPSTPKKGEKRKRSMEQSPAQPLPLEAAEPVASPAMVSNVADGTQLRSQDIHLYKAEDERYDLMQKLINHHPSDDSADLFFEALSAHSFPSRPSQRLSSIISSQLQLIPRSASFPLEMIRVMLAVWQQCLYENYYEPLHLLVDTTSFLLLLQPFSFAPQLTIELLPLLMNTVDTIAIDVGKAAMNGSYTLPPGTAAVEAKVPTEACIELLNHMAVALVDEEPPIRVFWHIIQFDFTLLVIMKSQPLSIMCSMLRILQTSVLSSSFGVIHGLPNGDVDVERQQSRENDLVDRLLNLLVEIPKPMKGKREYNERDIAELRLDVLDVFSAMCTRGFSPDTKQSHGGKLLAEHRFAIGRLFKFLSDSVNLLYKLPPQPVPNILATILSDDSSVKEPQDRQNSPHALTSRAVNTTVRILHHLIATYTSLIDLRQKLAAVHGGVHKHLIGLARLAFSDQVLMEAGIENEVTDAAHEMLDDFLTFEEGESILALFGTPAKTAPLAEDGNGGGGEDGDHEMEAEMEVTEL